MYNNNNNYNNYNNNNYPPQYNYNGGNNNKGFSIASMVCGIVAVVFYCAWFIAIPCGIVAVALSYKVLKTHPVGAIKGMSIAGLACGIVGIALGAITLIYAGMAASSLPRALRRMF